MNIVLFVGAHIVSLFCIIQLPGDNQIIDNIIANMGQSSLMMNGCHAKTCRSIKVNEKYIFLREFLIIGC